MKRLPSTPLHDPIKPCYVVHALFRPLRISLTQEHLTIDPHGIGHARNTDNVENDGIILPNCCKLSEYSKKLK